MRWLLSIGVALVVLLVGVGWYLNPIAPVATGYAAKALCSGVFVSDRDVDAVNDDLPSNPLVPLLRTSVDHEAGSVRTTVIGLWGSTAYHAPGLGCTLADERPLDVDAERFAEPTPIAAPPPDAPWPAGSAVGPPPDTIDTDHLDEAIEAAFVEDDVEGRRRNTRAVVVVKDGQLIAERYAEGIGPHTPLLGWSMSKSIASAMTGRLVLDEQLDISMAGLRDDWTDGRADITIEQLLTMTDGLPFEEVYDPGTDATRMLFRPGKAADVAAEPELEHAPGTHWEYSSGTTNILCDVLQREANAGPQLASELVFAPLGMSSAVMEPDATGGLVCASFTYATARDWARFGQWYLQDGVWDGERLLPEGWVTTSTTPVEVAGDVGYGYQIWLNEAADGRLLMPSVPAGTYWASGHEGQHVVVIPSERLVVVRLGLSAGFSGREWGLEPLLAEVVAATGGR